jgi:hypothetical protein
MTETTRGRSSARKSSESTQTKEPGASGPGSEVATRADATGDGGTAAPAARTPMTLTIRLPFFSATFSGPGSAPPAGAPLTPVVPVVGRDPGGTLEKMAFYGGVAAAGALGALEWPVAAAVAAGTWVAQHTPPPAGLLRATRPPVENRKPDENPKPAEAEPIAVTTGS